MSKRNDHSVTMFFYLVKFRQNLGYNGLRKIFYSNTLTSQNTETVGPFELKFIMKPRI
jgi:hypothetical protein